MKYAIAITLIVLVVGCAKNSDEEAKPLLDKISSLYKAGNYRAALDSIVVLRSRYPSAIESRKKALRIWQSASLRMAQDEIGKTDIKLQEAYRQLDSVTDRYKANMLRVKCDSLKARYDAMCGVVRMIHIRQKEK